MTMTRAEEVLLKVIEQHVAIVGMTGSGKTSTAKLMAESIFAAGHRACILDSVKSDWWGLTSSADGRRPGLPFTILGGPRGHIPLHSGAGAAIGRLVGSGELRHSIIDMADFEAGGLQRFFVDFVPTLMKSMRGVLYLIMEEAHEFAPKERAGFTAENMAIHYAKKLATAGRSKGIRIIVATQSVQQLHNRVFGSCGAIIGHQLTAPADKAPVLKWFKDNAGASELREVASSLSRLHTGQAWVYSGKPHICEQIQFPRIKTFDNSATPSGDEALQDVTVAQVDAAKLRDVISNAIKEAEDNDPKVLRARIKTLEEKVRDGASDTASENADIQREQVTHVYEQGRLVGYAQGAREALKDLPAALHRLQTHRDGISEAIAGIASICDAKPAVPIGGDEDDEGAGESANLMRIIDRSERARLAQPLAAEPSRQVESAFGLRPPGTVTERLHRAFLTALTQHPKGLTKGQILTHTGYASSGATSTAFAALAREGYTEQSGPVVKITGRGEKALGSFKPLPVGRELRVWLLNGSGKLSKVERAVMEALFTHYPEPMQKGDILKEAGYASSGATSTAFARLCTMGYAEPAGTGRLRAGADLYTAAERRT